jgi:hypothetical protein
VAETIDHYGLRYKIRTPLASRSAQRQGRDRVGEARDRILGKENEDGSLGAQAQKLHELKPSPTSHRWRRSGRSRCSAKSSGQRHWSLRESALFRRPRRPWANTPSARRLLTTPLATRRAGRRKRAEIARSSDGASRARTGDLLGAITAESFACFADLLRLCSTTPARGPDALRPFAPLCRG